jgi:hypothetical protein
MVSTAGVLQRVGVATVLVLGVGLGACSEDAPVGQPPEPQESPFGQQAHSHLGWEPPAEAAVPDEATEPLVPELVPDDPVEPVPVEEADDAGPKEPEFVDCDTDPGCFIARTQRCLRASMIYESEEEQDQIVERRRWRFAIEGTEGSACALRRTLESLDVKWQAPRRRRARAAGMTKGQIEAAEKNVFIDLKRAGQDVFVCKLAAAELAKDIQDELTGRAVGLSNGCAPAGEALNIRRPRRGWRR